MIQNLCLSISRVWHKSWVCRSCLDPCISQCSMSLAISFEFEGCATEQPHKLLHVLELKHGDGGRVVDGAHLDPLPLESADAPCRS